jgi:general secretion pathway protein A
MYNEHFGFREAPFTAIPSSKFFYANTQYREAFANLRYGIKWRKGLVVVVGEVGTGKTTLLRKIVCNLETDVHPIFVSYDHLTYEQLLRLISKELGVPAHAQDRFALVESIHEALLEQQKNGRAVALLIDEAQTLSDETFDDIRFLTNLETDRGKLLQIVLSGQPELDARLSQARLRHIKQRIVLNCRLAPLDEAEVELYIESRLQQAGYYGPNLFSAQAIRDIAV